MNGMIAKLQTMNVNIRKSLFLGVGGGGILSILSFLIIWTVTQSPTNINHVKISSLPLHSNEWNLWIQPLSAFTFDYYSQHTKPHHKYDACLDLVVPEPINIQYVCCSRDDETDYFEIDYQVKMALFNPQGEPSSFLLIGRSSLMNWSRNFMLATPSPGVIDGGFRGRLISRFRPTCCCCHHTYDNHIDQTDFTTDTSLTSTITSPHLSIHIPIRTRLIQLCTPSFQFPTTVRILLANDSLPVVDTRNEHGFGSTK
jgi:hypothetical protein